MPFVFVVLAAVAVAALPFVSPAMALVAGAALAFVVRNPAPARTRRLAHRLMVIAVIGLGGAVDLRTVVAVGARGLLLAAVSIGGALLLAALLGRLLGISRDLALLVGVGTAICGGAAIAAVAPIVRARDQEVSLALAIVFLLNAVALFAFPAAAHLAGLDGARFATWAALGIHDTSSVVAATLRYAPDAVGDATTLKLARALYILPVGLLLAHHRRAVEGGGRGLPRPWFIAGFVALSAAVTFVPALAPAGLVAAAVARRLLVAALLLVGLGVSRAALAQLGWRPLAHGVALWLLVAAGSLFLSIR